MQLKSRRAAEFINEMVALELIEPTMPLKISSLPGCNARSCICECHFCEANSSRNSRTGPKRVRGSRECCKRFERICVAVKSAVLFGSMLSCVDRLGDVDVAIDLRPSISDSAKFKQQCDRRRHLAEDRGRHSLYLNGRLGLRKKLCYS